MVYQIIVGFVALVVIVLLVAYIVNAYNQLVSLRKRCSQAKQNIDVVLKQRQDELTKLVDAAEEFMQHEQELLTQLTEAREQAERASTPKEEAQADQQVQNALANFRARMEDYPELQSQENLLQLQEQIAALESQIADRREVYNEAVTQYNTRINQFPYVLIAQQMGFQARELFDAPEGDTQDVNITEAFA